MVPFIMSDKFQSDQGNTFWDIGPQWLELIIILVFFFFFFFAVIEGNNWG